MPSQVVHDAISKPVTPASGKGTLGTWRPWSLGGDRSLNRVFPPGLSGRVRVQTFGDGVYVRPRLSFTSEGKARGGKAKVKTGLGKSDRPGL